METETQYTYFVGLDLGQSRDYTAVVILEHAETFETPPPMNGADAFAIVGFGDATGKPSKPIQLAAIEETYHVRYCNRLALNTPYPEIVRWTSELVKKLMARARVGLIVDATGVGRPIIDMFRESRLKVVPVNVTGGQHASFSGGVWNVPKKDLVSAAKKLLTNGILKIDESTEFKDVLRTEIENFRIKINERTRHESYESWREGDHDDLVFALSLACWWALKRQEKVGKAYMPVVVGEGEGSHSQLPV